MVKILPQRRRELRVAQRESNKPLRSLCPLRLCGKLLFQMLYTRT